MLIVKIKAQLLNVAKEICPNIRFYPDAEGMTVVGYDILQYRPEKVARQHNDDNGKESTVEIIGQKIIKGGAGCQGENKIYCRNQAGTQQVNGK